MAGGGLIGLRVIFSLKAVDRPKLLLCSAGVGRSGSVSDLFTRFLTIGTLLSKEASLLWECRLVEVGGDGSLVEDAKAEGSRACDLDCDKFEACRPLTGTGRLLKVLLLGMPPMGSSGRQT